MTKMYTTTRDETAVALRLRMERLAAIVGRVMIRRAACVRRSSHHERRLDHLIAAADKTLNELQATASCHIQGRRS